MDSASRECCEEWKLKLKSSEDTCEVLRKNAQKIKERIVDSSWILNQFKQGQEKLKKTNEEILEYKKNNQLLTSQLEQERQETSCLRQQLEQMLNANGPTLKELETLKDELQKKINLLQVKDAYVFQLEATVKEGKEARDSFEKVQKDASRLHKDLSAKEAQYKGLTKKLKTKDTHIEGLNNQIEKLNASLETANSTILTLELELDMLKEKGATQDETWEGIDANVESFDHSDFSRDIEPDDVTALEKSNNELARSTNNLSLSGSGSKMDFPRISTKEPSPETSPPHKRTTLENKKRSSKDDETSFTPSPSPSPSEPFIAPRPPPSTFVQPVHPAAESSPRRRRRSDGAVTLPPPSHSKKNLPPVPPASVHVILPPSSPEIPVLMDLTTPDPVEIVANPPITINQPSTVPTTPSPTQPLAPIVNFVCPIPISPSPSIAKTASVITVPFSNDLTSPAAVPTPKPKPTEISPTSPTPALPITPRHTTPRRLQMERQTDKLQEPESLKLPTQALPPTKPEPANPPSDSSIPSTDGIRGPLAPSSNTTIPTSEPEQVKSDLEPENEWADIEWEESGTATVPEEVDEQSHMEVTVPEPESEKMPTLETAQTEDEEPKKQETADNATSTVENVEQEVKEIITPTIDLPPSPRPVAEAPQTAPQLPPQSVAEPPQPVPQPPQPAPRSVAEAPQPVPQPIAKAHQPAPQPIAISPSIPQSPPVSTPPASNIQSPLSQPPSPLSPPQLAAPLPTKLTHQKSYTRYKRAHDASEEKDADAIPPSATTKDVTRTKPSSPPQPRISYQNLLLQPTSPTYPQEQPKPKATQPKKKRKKEARVENPVSPTIMKEDNPTSMLSQHPIISSMLVGISQSVELEPPLSPSLLPEDPMDSEWEKDKSPFPADMVACAFLEVLHNCAAPSKADIAVQLFWQIFQATAKGNEFRYFCLRRIITYLVSAHSASSVAHFCQLYARICKSNADLDQVLQLSHEILRQAPTFKTQLLLALAQWWPDPFIAKELKMGQPLLNVIEHVVSFTSSDLANPECSKEIEAYISLRKICYWPYRENPRAVNIASLVPTLLDSFIQSVDDPESDPRALIPLRTTIICKALELIGKYKGYVWTYNDLIVSQLWSLMAPTAANCKKPKLIPATVRLVGILGRSAENEALQELRSKMTLILSPHFIEKHKLSFLAQTCVALTLIDLSKGDATITNPCKIWYNALPLDKRHEISHVTALIECIKKVNM